MGEIWVVIPGLEGYIVSSIGRVKSLNYNKTGKEGVMAFWKDRRGYIHVNILRKRYSVHRLVWIAFKGPIPEGMQINHIDEDKSNNRLENLELMTPKQNLNYGSRSAKAAASKSKTVYQYTLSGEFVKKWESAKTIERECGYWHGSISAACRGKYKTAYGYKWTF